MGITDLFTNLWVDPYGLENLKDSLIDKTATTYFCFDSKPDTLLETIFQ